MLIALSIPLAAADPIVALIFFAIWALVIVVSAIQRGLEARRKREQQQPKAPTAAQPKGKTGRPARRWAVQTQRKPPRMPQMKPTAPVRLAKKLPPATLPPKAVPKLPPLPSPAAAAIRGDALGDDLGQLAGAASSRSLLAEIGSDEAARQKTTEGPAVNAAALAVGLQPANFRKLFILTELLQPPLALRQEG